MTAARSAWRTNRPRSVPTGCSRTPWASMRGSSTSRRSIASCRSAGSSDSASLMSCSIVQRLVCLPWKVSWSATPKQRSTAGRASRPGDDRLARAEEGVGVELLQEITTRLPGREWEDVTWTSLPSQASSRIKRPSTTTLTRRAMRHTTGGTLLAADLGHASSPPLKAESKAAAGLVTVEEVHAPSRAPRSPEVPPRF